MIMEMVEKGVFIHDGVCYFECIHIGKPTEHSLKGRRKRDYLKFWLDLANQLTAIGNHTSRWVHRRSSDSGCLDRLNIDLGHWPV